MPRSAAGRQHIERRLGVPCAAIAVLGRWEPHLPPERCLQEVAARAAGALALAEAAHDDAATPPFLLSAEAHLRGQPRPGCWMAAEALVELGADPRSIRCWPAANRTAAELRALDQMRRALGTSALVLVTSPYHVARVGHLIRRAGRARDTVVVSCTGPLVREALGLLPDRRRRSLEAAIRRGVPAGLARARAVVAEVIGFGAALFPGLEARVAGAVRGAADPGEMVLQQPRPAGPERCQSRSPSEPRAR